MSLSKQTSVFFASRRLQSIVLIQWMSLYLFVLCTLASAAITIAQALIAADPRIVILSLRLTHLGWKHRANDFPITQFPLFRLHGRDVWGCTYRCSRSFQQLPRVCLIKTGVCLQLSDFNHTSVALFSWIQVSHHIRPKFDNCGLGRLDKRDHLRYHIIYFNIQGLKFND